MTPIVYLLLKLGFLLLLWLFVFAAVQTVRSDLFGRTPRPAVPARPVRPPRAARPPGRNRDKGRRTATVLVVTEGDLAGTRISLGAGPITLGRAPDSTLVLTDDYASHRHARLVPRGDQWLVEDLGSTNGTYLDREKVTGPTLVPLAVPVRIGKTALELRP